MRKWNICFIQTETVLFTHWQWQHMIKKHALHYFTSYCMLNMAAIEQMKWLSDDSQSAIAFSGFNLMPVAILYCNSWFRINFFLHMHQYIYIYNYNICAVLLLSIWNVLLNWQDFFLTNASPSNMEICRGVWEVVFRRDNTNTLQFIL